MEENAEEKGVGSGKEAANDRSIGEASMYKRDKA